jgi:predicted transglutaminase-like cysteine proteinase
LGELIVYIQKYILSVIAIAVIAGAASPAGLAVAGVRVAGQNSMTLVALGAAPQGYVDFCRREPADCRAFGNDLGPTLPIGWPISALTAETTAGRTGADHVPTKPSVVMTSGVWALINRINDSVNRAIKPQDDRITYGVADYWGTPLEHGLKAGDCEDYVLEKRRALLAAGLPAQALSIAVVKTIQGDGHAVLLVGADDDWYVLDSLTPVIAPWRETNYTWLERQVAGSRSYWEVIAPADQHRIG